MKHVPISIIRALSHRCTVGGHLGYWYIHDERVEHVKAIVLMLGLHQDIILTPAISPMPIGNINDDISRHQIDLEEFSKKAYGWSYRNVEYE